MCELIFERERRVKERDGHEEEKEREKGMSKSEQGFKVAIH